MTRATTNTAADQRTAEYGMWWVEVGANEIEVLRTQWFRTDEARHHFANLVAERPTFVRFVAWSN